MSELEKEILAKRKRRGVVRASTTRMKSKIRDLEGQTDRPDTPSLARRMLQKIETLSSEFMQIHYSLVELIEDEGELAREQTILDEHDNDIAHLSAAVERLLSLCSPSSAPDTTNGKKLVSRKLTCIKKRLESVSASTSRSEELDQHLLLQYEADLLDYKRDLNETQHELMTLDLDEALEDLVFHTSLKLRKLLQTNSGEPLPPSGANLKLPKIDTPKFDGNILNWRAFWEQFNVSIHSRKTLTEAEKLVYLRNAVSEGSAKQVIEGLSRSGECYEEAIESLQTRYNRPRLIHKAHVKLIVESQPLKEGSGKELRRLHDTVQQHLRALKAMGYKPSGPFLKLDQNTMFEWQRYSQEHSEVPGYQDLLEFLNLRAQASETSIFDQQNKGKPTRNDQVQTRKGLFANKSVTSYAVSAIEQSSHSNCVVCKVEKHPLYTCPKFRALPHSGKLAVTKSNNLCINCLKSGHFIRECKSLHRCKICQKPHHSLMHSDTKCDPCTPSTSVAQAPSISPVMAHAASGLDKGILLMTCRLLIKTPEGMSFEARGILDSASSASFVTERLAQTLNLPRSTCNARISGIAGLSHGSPTQSVATFNIAPLHAPNKVMNVSAIVVPRVTHDLPVVPIQFNSNWSHITDISLADPKFGIPGRIDLLLGVDIFAGALGQGRRCGAPDSPVAFETEFGWVLAGNAGPSDNLPNKVISHHVHTSLTSVSCDDVLKRFWEVEEMVSKGGPLTGEEKYVAQHFKSNHYCTDSGAFVVPLPKGQNSKALGESRSKALRRFIHLERSLLNKTRQKSLTQ